VPIFIHNLVSCWPILKILKLLDLAVNLQQGLFYYQPHLKSVTTLPCQIQKLNSSDTLDVFNTS